MKKVLLICLAVMMLGFFSAKAAPMEKMTGTVVTVTKVTEGSKTHDVATVALPSGAYYAVVLHTPKTVAQHVTFILLPPRAGRVFDGVEMK